MGFNKKDKEATFCVIHSNYILYVHTLWCKTGIFVESFTDHFDISNLSKCKHCTSNASFT